MREDNIAFAPALNGRERTGVFPRGHTSRTKVEWSCLKNPRWKNCMRAMETLQTSSDTITKSEAEGSNPKGIGPLF